MTMMLYSIIFTYIGIIIGELLWNSLYIERYKKYEKILFIVTCVLIYLMFMFQYTIEIIDEVVSKYMDYVLV